MKRPWLLPLSPLWAAGAAWKNRGFDQDPGKAKRLQRPVISVGSLSAGGAGKTPFVIALGHALQQGGISVDVLSRGYGRVDLRTPRRVDATGLPDDFGDEPLLIARALRAPVYVASQRIDAGRLAESDAANDAAVHLLDDGFQHRQLARAVDIVLLTEQDVRDMLLPAGDLREPLKSLRRTDIIVLRAEEADSLRPAIARVFGAATPPPIWRVERRFRLDRPPAGHPLAFCGIARPEGFRAALQDQGTMPAGFVALRDHQRYDAAVMAELLHAAKRAGADGFVTTAKDAVKLLPERRAVLEAVGPLAVADVVVHLADEQQCMSTLKQMLWGITSS